MTTMHVSSFLAPFIFAFLGWIIAKISVSLYISAILKRKLQISKTIGDYVAKQVSFDAVEQKLTAPENVEKILPFADEHVEHFLRVKLPAAMPMLAMFISDKLVTDMKGIFMNELKELFPALILQYTGNIKKDLNISQLVSDKLSSVSFDTLKPLLKQQLHIVEIACAVTGFLCGGLHIFLT